MISFRLGMMATDVCVEFQRGNGELMGKTSYEGRPRARRVKKDRRMNLTLVEKSGWLLKLYTAKERGTCNCT